MLGHLQNHNEASSDTYTGSGPGYVYSVRGWVFILIIDLDTVVQHDGVKQNRTVLQSILEPWQRETHNFFACSSAFA